MKKKIFSEVGSYDLLFGTLKKSPKLPGKKTINILETR